jgi:2-(1,2-epoxy-1,2-dihydrophenyl)acetyl-CoA isomerase
MSDCIIERDGGVMLIRFNRPERMNAMGGTLLQEMDDAFREGQADDRVRAFVVTGEGRAWCAGAAGCARSAPASAEAPRHNRRATAIDAIGSMGRTVLNVYNCDKPTIAAVNGVAVGGGFGLCTAMDIRIASDQARFSTMFIRRALGPDFGLSWFLPRLIGPERAAEMFFTGRMVDATGALALGVVSKVVPHESLLEGAMALARTCAKQPPSALTYTRRALQHAQFTTLEQQLEFEWTNQTKCIASAEFQEGVAAFREKREADFSRF